MNRQHLVSVVIPTYRRRDSVERCLRALARQTLPADQYEVIVSIDGSEDGTREMVEALLAPYALQALWQPNRVRAAACNAGIAAASGRILVLLDDDMEPDHECLEMHARRHAEDSQLGVVGAAPIVPDQTAPKAASYVTRKFNHHLESLAEEGYQFKLRDFYSGNFSIQRALMNYVGGFDDAFKVYGNEDVELSLRLRAAGVRLVFEPTALAWQHNTKDFASLAQDNVAKGQTAVLLAMKHPETYADLKLSDYERGSRKWRAVRAVLLRADKPWPISATVVKRIVPQFDRFLPRRQDLYYSLALDFFFWLGVRSALQQQDSKHGWLASLQRLSTEAKP